MADCCAAWIDPSVQELEAIAALVEPDADALCAQPVSKRVEGPELIAEAPEAGF